MPPITITEKDFSTLAWAAKDARDAGNTEQAIALDKLARMANAALTASVASNLSRTMFGKQGAPVRWRDMPSTIE